MFSSGSLRLDHSSKNVDNEAASPNVPDMSPLEIAMLDNWNHASFHNVVDASVGGVQNVYPLLFGACKAARRHVTRLTEDGFGEPDQQE